LLIPFSATTIGVECVFSQGRLVLPHVQNRLSSQMTHAVMTIGAWSKLGLVKDLDIKTALEKEDQGPEEELPASWNAIQVLL